MCTATPPLVMTTLMAAHGGVILHAQPQYRRLISLACSLIYCAQSPEHTTEQGPSPAMRELGMVPTSTRERGRDRGKKERGREREGGHPEKKP